MGLYVFVFGTVDVAAIISISPPRQLLVRALEISRFFLFFKSCSRCVFVNGATPDKLVFDIFVFVKFVPVNTASVRSAPDKSIFVKFVPLSTPPVKLTRGTTMYASCAAGGTDACTLW